ncbi:two component transcriptional regulator, winged helix family [Pseudoduganella flava]|nr:two component transcriptional regulator, winged helix family [Pseudoduganella flava]
MLAAAVCERARQAGLCIDHARDAPAARVALVDHAYSAILLDLGLPGESGLVLLQGLRAAYDATPVIVLTARGQMSERIAGLDAGADDYLVKPFDFDELWARLRAVTRRSEGKAVPVLTCGDVRLDLATQRVTRAGTPVTLSAFEYRTLLVFMERANRIVTRAQLETLIYGDGSDIGSNTVAVFIHQLRRKLGERIIETVHGQGYVLRKESA